MNNEPERIAIWLETLHCDRPEGMCWKTNCRMFRSLALRIRSREYNDE